MSTTTINTDLGKNLEWRAYRYGHNEVKFVFTENGDPFDLTDFEFSMVFRSPGKSTEVLELNEDGWISNGGANGILTITLTAEDIEDLVQDRYYFEIRYTKGGNQYRLSQGYIHLQKEQNQSNDNIEIAMPVTDSAGQTVNMSVYALGAVIDFSTLDSAALQNLFDAILNAMTPEQKAILWNAMAEEQLKSNP